MEQQTFFNTISESGEQLKRSKLKNGCQQAKIYQYLLIRKGTAFTPCQIHSAIFNNDTPLTSCRRALTNLTEVGLITKFDEQTMGNFGKKTYTWGIKND